MKFKLHPAANMRLLVIALLGEEELNRVNVDQAIAQVEVHFEMSDHQHDAMLHAFFWL